MPSMCFSSLCSVVKTLLPRSSTFAVRIHLLLPPSLTQACEVKAQVLIHLTTPFHVSELLNRTRTAGSGLQPAQEGDAHTTRPTLCIVTTFVRSVCSCRKIELSFTAHVQVCMYAGTGRWETHRDSCLARYLCLLNKTQPVLCPFSHGLQRSEQPQARLLQHATGLQSCHARGCCPRQGCFLSFCLTVTPCTVQMTPPWRSSEQQCRAEAFNCASGGSVLLQECPRAAGAPCFVRRLGMVNMTNATKVIAKGVYWRVRG